MPSSRKTVLLLTKNPRLKTIEFRILTKDFGLMEASLESLEDVKRWTV